jgi:hypothetical protein
MDPRSIRPGWRWRRFRPGRHWRLGLFLNLTAMVWALDRVMLRMPMVQSRRIAVLAQLFGAVALTAPTDYYIALSTTTPTDTATNFTEPSGNAYARVQKTNNTTNFPTPTSADPTVSSNGTAVTFPTATGAWGTVTHAGWFTVISAGTPVEWAALSASQAIGNGATASFAIGQLQSQLDAV